MWRVVASVTRGNAETDDLAQDAFIRAFSAIRTYRGDASFEAWLCRIALNAAHDYQRSAWKRRILLWDFGGNNKEASGQSVVEAALEKDVSHPEGEAERRDLQRRVREAVAKLKEKERVPIWLIYFEEFTLAQVARLEGEAESTIRSRVKAGLKRLSDSLGDLNLSVDEERETISLFATIPPDTATQGVGLATQKTAPLPTTALKGCNR